MEMKLFGDNVQVSEIDNGLSTLMRDSSIQLEVTEKLFRKGNLKDSSFELLTVAKTFQSILEKQVDECKYDWCIPSKIVIPKKNGKERIIYLHERLSDRFMAGMLYQVLSRYFDNTISQHVFSYKKGISTGSTVRELVTTGKLSNKYCVKLDIKSFFNSVDESYLASQLNKLMGDSVVYKKLLTDLLFTNKVTTRQGELDEFMGLIPGSAVSSFLANYILKDVDDYLGNQDNVVYARYSDDIILFTDTVEQQANLLDWLGDRLQPIGLVIHPDKLEFFTPREPVEFLGLRLCQLKGGSFSIDIGDSTFTRMKKVVKELAKQTNKNIKAGKDPDRELATLIFSINTKFFGVYMENGMPISYAKYIYSNINSIERSRQLDFYIKEQLRFAVTGRYNKGTLKKVPYTKMLEFGLISFVDIFHAYRIDKDYFFNRCESIVKHRLDVKR